MSDKLNLRYQQLSDAIERLDEVMKKSLAQDDIVLDAAIQRFEFTYELTWKFLQKKLAQEGIQVNSPRQAFAEAYQIGYINNEELWLKMIKDRNLTTHTYKKATALDVYNNLADYLPLLKTLIKKTAP